MRRLLNSFILVFSLVVVLGYGYLAWSMAETMTLRIALIFPFFLVWIVPVRYWTNDEEPKGWRDDIIHYLSYLSMGWLNFLLGFTVVRDVLWFAAIWLQAPRVEAWLHEVGSSSLLGGSLLALAFGILAAIRGPHVRYIDLIVDDLDPALDGFRIVQITDLHAGPTIGRRYVQRVARMTSNIKPDLVALTGDLLDGSVPRLAATLAPLSDLKSTYGSYLVLGNHEYYAGAQPWIDHFRSIGINVLLNESMIINVNGSALVIGGVTDPAAAQYKSTALPDPHQAIGGKVNVQQRVAYRLLLAHNPKIASRAADAGFDLQLSGHTHAGQFFPWNFVVRLLHAPHVAGLSREGNMWVYVSAGTGTWGPPIRLGTSTELTVLRLIRRYTIMPEQKGVVG